MKTLPRLEDFAPELATALLDHVARVPDPVRIELLKPVVHTLPGGRKLTQTHYLRKRRSVGMEEMANRYAKGRFGREILPLPVPGRNAPCPCGSGKKFKKCCKSGFE